MGSTASMPLYLMGDDVGLLISHFNEDDEVAWLVPDGWGRWIAREQVEELYERTVHGKGGGSTPPARGISPSAAPVRISAGIECH
jgi:hypothetical protein